MKACSIYCILFYSVNLAHSAPNLSCKCDPGSDCWPSQASWTSLNRTIHGALLRGGPPASACYSDEPDYDERICAAVRSQWFNSTWHAEHPVSIDYPIWTNNSCNPIFPNGTSVTGDHNAGARGCSIGAYPKYVVNATNRQQISAALKWADTNNIRVVIKSTGHSYQGRSVGYGSLSIWTHNLRGIKYVERFKPAACASSEEFDAARIAAGHAAIDVQLELAKHNAFIVTGANPSVGPAGWLTGGGHGPMSTTYGMGADNLLQATIVTPAGDTYITSPCQNTDLFFAVRGGGGGTYGVVTELIVRAYPSPKTTKHVFQMASLDPDTYTEYYEFLGYLHKEFPRLKKGGMQGYYYIAGQPIVPSLSFQWTFWMYDKPEGTVESLMRPIEAYLDEHKHLFVYNSNITHADTYLGIYNGEYINEDVATGGSAYGSRLLSEKSLVDKELSAKVFEQIGPSTNASRPNAPVSNPLVIGHFINPSSAPTYYPDTISMNPAWRNTLTHLVVVSSWPDGTAQSIIDSVYADITHNKTEALRQFSPDTGAYFNEGDSCEPEWQQAFFGENYAWLKRIKEKYDPRNVLWCWKCVGSEALVEQPDGRLCKHKDREEDENASGDKSEL